MVKYQCKQKYIFIIIISLGILTGCVKAQFTEPITTYSDSINTSGAAISQYYNELNRFEREMYLEERLYDDSLEVTAKDGLGKPTPLVGTFSALSIKARKDAIALLGVYAKRLGELAGSEAPQEFAAGTQVLGENLINLQKTFIDLNQGNDRNQVLDNSAQNYIQPIGTLVGVIGSIYLEHQRNIATEKAINEGAPAVREILQFLQKDLTNTIIPLQRTGLKEQLAVRVNDYNINRKQVSFEKRKKMLSEIEKAVLRYDAFLISNPDNLIQSMSIAHEALVKYAQSDKSPTNLAELTSVLETFKRHAQEVIESLRQISELRKG